jgi:DNA-binding NtrC family response regulator
MKIPVIFIVDKNTIHSNLLRYQLMVNKFSNVQVFSSVEDCLYRLRREEGPVYLVADSVLGDFTGIEFLRMAKKISPQVHVIFFSSTEDADHASELLEGGATDYILKGTKIEQSMTELIRNLQFIINERVRISGE